MNEDIKISIVKYITGQASEAESFEVKEWIKSSPENEAYYIQLYETWHNSLYINKDSVDVDKAFNTFYRKNIEPDVPAYRRLTLGRHWLGIAASLVLLCMAGIYYYKKNNTAEQWLTVKVAKGTTRKLTLPDGSSVWINSGSNIRYSRAFGVNNRTVFLSGEAYFDIAPSGKNIPFLVKAGQFTIRDVGTVFNVKAYPDEKIFETAVVEGKVSVEGVLTENADYQSKVFLDAKQVLKINRQASVSMAKPKNVKTESLEPVKVVQIEESQFNEYNGWKDNLLVFENDSFEEIAKVLERRYNVKIFINDENLKGYHYTGTFRNLSNINTVFKVIKETTPINYVVNGNAITVENMN